MLRVGECCTRAIQIAEVEMELDRKVDKVRRYDSFDEFPPIL